MERRGAKRYAALVLLGESILYQCRSIKREYLHLGSFSDFSLGECNQQITSQKMSFFCSKLNSPRTQP